MALLERFARDLSIALIVGVGIGLTLTYVGVGEALHLVPSQPDQDWQAYLNAAERLRAGLLLYPSVTDPGAASVYRYAPWFAVAWIPLTFLPRDAVGVGWVIVMFAASAAALWPLLSSRRLGLALLAGLLAPFLAGASIHGNVQPLIVAALVHTLDRRAGPITIGLAASLKGFPLLYAVRYAVLGEWRRCLAATVVAVVMTAPILLFDLRHYPLVPGPLTGLWLVSPLAWGIGALAGLVALWRLARRRVGWFATSLAVVMAMPRLLYYDMTYLLVTGRSLPIVRSLGGRRAGRSGRRAGVAESRPTRRPRLRPCVASTSKATGDGSANKGNGRPGDEAGNPEERQRLPWVARVSTHVVEEHRR